MSDYFEEKINEISDDCRLTDKYKSTPSEYGNGGLCHDRELRNIKVLAEMKSSCPGLDASHKDECSENARIFMDDIKEIGAWKNVPAGQELLHYLVEEK